MSPAGIVVITGASRGIGAATARLAAGRGCAVVVNYRSGREAAEALVAEVEAGGGQALAVQADVSTESGVAGLFAAVDDWRGERPLTGLVNNAGVDGGRDPIERVTAADVAPLYMVNVVGTVLCCREAVRRMAARNGGPGGAIVNVSSMSATIGGRVNAVRPGMTLTDMTAERLNDPARRAEVDATIPMGRVATPDEIARPIVWLLSEEASFVSGCLLDVSGGGFVIGAPRPPSGGQ